MRVEEIAIALPYDGRVLHCIYMSSGISTKPKTRPSKIDALKETMRAWDCPEEILTGEALARPHRTLIDFAQQEQNKITQPTNALKQQMFKELRKQLLKCIKWHP